MFVMSEHASWEQKYGPHLQDSPEFLFCQTHPVMLFLTSAGSLCHFTSEDRRFLFYPSFLPLFGSMSRCLCYINDQAVETMFAKLYSNKARQG